jgi:hypothetical protein
MFPEVCNLKRWWKTRSSNKNEGKHLRKVRWWKYLETSSSNIINGVEHLWEVWFRFLNQHDLAGVNMLAPPLWKKRELRELKWRVTISTLRTAYAAYLLDNNQKEQNGTGRLFKNDTLVNKFEKYFRFVGPAIHFCQKSGSPAPFSIFFYILLSLFLNRLT